MIDTIGGYINLKKHTYSDFQHLLEKKTKRMTEDGYIIPFNLLNIKITIKFDSYDNALTLRFNGSLPKFYFGNNLAQLDWDTTKCAIQMLSDNLNIDMNEAILTRIDFGINFILKKPIHHYISCLVDFPRLEWNRYKDSITFSSKSGSKSLIFYDKLKELKINDNTTYKSVNKVTPA